MDVKRIESEFQDAADYVQAQVTAKNPAFNARDKQLILYGLYKQSMVGACNVKKPGMLDLGGRAKWDAWSKLGSMSSEEAKLQYVQVVMEIDRAWRPHLRGNGGTVHAVEKYGRGEEEEEEEAVAPEKRPAKTKSSGMGPVFSAFAYEDEDKEGGQVI